MRGLRARRATCNEILFRPGDAGSHLRMMEPELVLGDQRRGNQLECSPFRPLQKDEVAGANPKRGPNVIRESGTTFFVEDEKS